MDKSLEKYSEGNQATPWKKLKTMANRLTVTNKCALYNCGFNFSMPSDPAVTLLFVLLPAAIELPSFLVSYHKALQVHKGHRVPAYQALHLGLAVGNVPSLAKRRNKEYD